MVVVDLGYKKGSLVALDRWLKKKKKTLWPLFMDEVQLPQGYSHFEEAVYFLNLVVLYSNIYFLNITVTFTF